MRGARLVSLLLVCAGLAGCRSGARPARTVAEVEAPAPEVASGRDGDITIGAAFEGAALLGTADGSRDSARLGPGCRGLILDEGVNHFVHIAAEQPLTLAVTPRGVGTVDLTLGLRTPSGEWICADDSTTLDPVLAHMFSAGEHRVVVGTATRTIVPYELTIRAGVHTPDPIALGGRFPAPITEGVEPERTSEGTFGGLKVPAGTGLATLAGQAGGTRDAGDLAPRCPGWIAQVPDHVLEVEAPDELTLRVRSEGDTTLAVQGPNGVVLCADDEDGLDPVIRDAFQMGRYSVYVGSYEERETPPYTLSVSR